MIRPIFPLTLDPARYLTIVPVEPVQTPDGLTPPVKATLDYALLAADLDVQGWPDELTDAIAALAPTPPFPYVSGAA